MNLQPEQIQELEAIRAGADDGRLHAAHVVVRARDPKSALHGNFEWDNRRAADAYRLGQARRLIEVYVTEVPGVGECRAFVSVAGSRPGYQRVEDVMADNVTRERLLGQMRSEMRSLLKRYAYLRPLAPEVFAEIETVLAGRVERVAA
jgi:hypothetical protein